MEKKNLLLVSGIMIVLVVAVFGIVMFSSGEKDTDNPSKEINFMGDTITNETENVNVTPIENCNGVCNLSSSSGDGGSEYTLNSQDIKLRGNGYQEIPQDNFLDETREENSESEDKITEA